LKDSSNPVIIIEKFSSQLYITTLNWGSIWKTHLCKRLNTNEVVVNTNICRIEKSCYISKRIIRANTSEVHLTLIRVSKYKVHIISEEKEYIIPEVVESKLIKSSKKIQSTLIKIKCNKLIPCKFKIMKFIT